MATTRTRMVAAILLLGASPAVAQSGDELGLETLKAGASNAAAGQSPIKVFTKKVCPSEETLHLCAQIIQTEPTKSYPPAISLAGITITPPGAGTAIVSWRGTAYCEFFPFTRNLDVFTSSAYVLNLQIQTGAPTDPEFNGPGYAAVGSGTADYKPGDFNPSTSRKNFDLYPVNITRTFAVKKSAGKTNYFLRAKAEFRLMDKGVCNINGGEMTVVFVKS